jgi:hypothetical protein
MVHDLKLGVKCNAADARLGPPSHTRLDPQWVYRYVSSAPGRREKLGQRALFFLQAVFFADNEPAALLGD